ncbi:MAG: hypothetical protein ACYC8V_16095 [Caulobacteraceae bacterium]
MPRGYAPATAFLAAIGALAGSPALDAPPVARAVTVQAVIDCRKIDDGPRRLVCYDKAVAAMGEAEAKGDLVTIDREQRRAARRQAFGLPLPSLSFLDRGEKPEEVNRIAVKIAGARQDAYGKWTIVLDDGAVWRQIDDNSLSRPPHAGSTADIRRAALGSFFVKIDGQQALRMHRDR